MGSTGRSHGPLLVLGLGVAWLALCGGWGPVGANAQNPALFLTVKSSNFGMTKFDHVKCGYLIVTDILVSPDGVPLPFFNDNSVTKRKSGLKIIVSFGGSVVPSELFAFLSCDDHRRAAFVINLVDFTLAHGFHGIDLAWLYPAPQEREQYGCLLEDLRCACDRNGLLLTVTVPSRPSVIEVNYPVEKLQQYADYVILSTTEFRKLRKTSFIAPLYSCSPGSSNSIDYHVDRWKMAGLSCDKIVIVIQTMTLTYKLYIQNEYRVGTPALQLKIRPYYKICRKLYSGSLEIWDSNVKSAYAFRDLSWYSYENEKSIKEKVCFVVQQGLGGLAVLYYDEDDPINICGDGQFPLTAIVLAALQSQYQPASVISDSQIYHYDDPPASPLSQLDLRNYNAAMNTNRPLVVYVEEEQPNDPRVPATLFGQNTVMTGMSSNGTAAPVQVVDPFRDTFGSAEMFIDSMSDERYDDMFYSQAVPFVEVGEGVDMAPPVANQATSMDVSLMVSEPEPVPLTAQLFSETVPTGASSTCQLFSEQSDARPVSSGRGCSRKSCTSSRPCSHCAPPPPVHQLPGIRIFATAHGPTTTTTTVAPPPMHFFTIAPVTTRPPTLCQVCKPCVKFVAAASAEAPTPRPTPCPCTTAAPVPCPPVHLFSEQSRPVVPVGSVRIQAKAVGAEPIVPFAPFEVKICPHDGILQDPHDRGSYYLCKRGLPMCDENRFSCAHGYIFNEACKKCVPEGSF